MIDAAIIPLKEHFSFLDDPRPQHSIEHDFYKTQEQGHGRQKIRRYLVSWLATLCQKMLNYCLKCTAKADYLYKFFSTTMVIC